ncbi:hypothetical protein, partial [Parapedobacter sp. DT-150]|uniref:hypothetical protein n=1 Tax=Parapedobacter sp. DT-150 TaxID=3396162 RepID=UPI003F1CA27C
MGKLIAAINSRCLTTCMFLMAAFVSCSQTGRVSLEKAMHDVERGAYPGIDAIIIARHGETIYQHYANGMTPET